MESLFSGVEPSESKIFSLTSSSESDSLSDDEYEEDDDEDGEGDLKQETEWVM